MERKDRNLYVEALRIVAMLFVFACHLTIHLDWQLLAVPGIRFAVANTIVQYGQVGVCIFFMISGYFLARKAFKWSRVLLAWLPVFIYSLLILVATLFGRSLGMLSSLNPFFEGSEVVTTFLKELLPFLMNGYWFMSTYLILLLVAPFLNVLLEHCEAKVVRALIAGLLIASMLGLFTISIVGFSSLSKAIVCYLIGAYLNRYPDVYRNAGYGRLLVVIATCTAIMLAFNYLALSGLSLTEVLRWDDYGVYHDGIVPAFVAIAASCFAWALKRGEAGKQMRGGFARVIAALGGSTFGVYLLHENYLGWRVLWDVVNARVPAPGSVVGTVSKYLLLLVGLYLGLLVTAKLIDAAVVNPVRNAIGRTLPK